MCLAKFSFNLTLCVKHVVGGSKCDIVRALTHYTMLTCLQKYYIHVLIIYIIYSNTVVVNLNKLDCMTSPVHKANIKN